MSRSQLKFLRRVRIHDGECGAVARALHHEAKAISLPAALEKVSMATQERKVMSKKTFFKRIAVTAIAALGFGMLSVAPSQATVTSHSLTIDNAADAIETGETATAVLTHSFVNLGSQYDSVVINALVTSSNATTAGTLMLTVTDSYTSAGNTGAASVSPRYTFGGSPWLRTRGISDTGTIQSGIADSRTTAWVGRSSGDGSNWYFVSDQSRFFSSDEYSYSMGARDSLTITAGAADSTTAGTASRSYGTQITTRLVAPTAAGTYTVSVFTQVSNGGAALAASTVAATWTVTVTAADKSATAASTSTLRAGEVSTAAPWSGTAEGTDSAVTTAATDDADDTAAEATIFVLQKNGKTTNIAQESMTVTVSGPAFVSTSADARPTAGTAITVAVTTANTATPIYVWSNGTAGTATITITSVGGIVLGTETVKFSGDVTKIAIDTVYKKILRAGGFANSSAIDLLLTDANGLAVSGQSVSFISSNVAVVTNGTCTEYATAPGYYACSPSTVVGSTSGQSVTLTFQVVDPSVTTSTAYLTTTQAFTLGGAISTVVITANKASYSPGEAMILTATATDASGNPTYDGQAGPTWLVANKSLGGTALGSVMNVYYDGVSTSQARSALNPRTFRNDNTLFAPNASGEFTISGVYGTDSTKSVSLKLTVGDDAATAAASAATDAALEAIDAANAATDAANLAAEAADAATVAAEEARDAADAATAAVEALATEVATLMAALKAQITTLANTVAKIAKKVKA